MVKREKNTSSFDAKTRTLSWRIEWFFTAESKTCIDECVPSNKKLSKVIINHLEIKNKTTPKYPKQIEFETALLAELYILMRKERHLSKRPEYYLINIYS